MELRGDGFCFFFFFFVVPLLLLFGPPVLTHEHTVFLCYAKGRILSLRMRPVKVKKTIWQTAKKENESKQAQNSK